MFDTSSSTAHETPLDNLRLGDVLEIQGPSASGKSHFLYLLVISCILPNTYCSISLGGWDKVAVLFDTDASFSLPRFKQLLISHLETALKPTIDSDAIELLVKRSLQNLHICYPNSSAQVAATLLHLPSYHHTKLPNSEIGVLAVDSISAFYWSDRFAAEQLQPTAHPHRANKSFNPLHHVVSALQRFHSSHKPLIILTNWGLTPTKTTKVDENTSDSLYRQHLVPPPALFPDKDESGGSSSRSSVGALPLTLHIALSIPPIPQLSVETSLTDACMQESSKTRRNTRILGVLRSANSSQTSRFTFIVEDGRLGITTSPS
ncbi:hypothetical protein BT96DRAFT_912358 [Gymnopus androsaceus JB14]|uniref:Uncharacterized protein n=1 Tax=Gymnopus androsaceus JB14 TaxID=1447944 RepID=A0A6A4IKD6_9AGAR|nr:hypothetical protein BT96DRAFT_912358 [Gymnopus androsaceus JB14]